MPKKRKRPAKFDFKPFSDPAAQAYSLVEADGKRVRMQLCDSGWVHPGQARRLPALSGFLPGHRRCIADRRLFWRARRWAR